MSAVGDARKRQQGDHHTHWDAGVRAIIAAEVAKERERIAQAIEALPGPDGIGVSKWNDRAQNGYLIAIEEAALAARTVDVEAGR